MQPIATSNFWLLRAKTTVMYCIHQWHSCFGSQFVIKFLWRLSNSQCCQNLVSVLIICVHYWWGRKHSSQLGTFLGHLSSFFYCYWHTVYAAISLRCKQLLIPYFFLALAAYYTTGMNWEKEWYQLEMWNFFWPFNWMFWSSSGQTDWWRPEHSVNTLTKVSDFELALENQPFIDTGPSYEKTLKVCRIQQMLGSVPFPGCSREWD